MKFNQIFSLLFALLIASSANGQTFNGIGGLPFPPTGTFGITESFSDVSGVGILGGCKQIDNVTLNLDHTLVLEVGIFLIAPNGTFIELSTGNGGAGDNYTNTIFRDNAAQNIVNGSAPFSGPFRPEGRQNFTLLNPYPNTSPTGTFTLANTFNGVDADGTWTLYLNDFLPFDVGFLNSWSITFTSTGGSINVNLGPDISVCVGGSVTLNPTTNAPNPTGYAWSDGSTDPQLILNNITATATYTVTITDQSGCTGSDVVVVNASPAPTGTPQTLQACEGSLPGVALFNLTSIINAIGGGQTVNFFNDIGLTNPIPSPSTFVSTATTIYAVVTVGACSSDPIPIILEVLLADPSLYSMNIIPDDRCGVGTIEVLFTLPSAGVYTYNYTLICTDGTETNTVTTSANPIQLTVSSNCTLNINSITSQASGCIVLFSPPLTDNIVVNLPPTITVSPIEICAGESVDLNDFVTVSGGANLTFHSSSPPTPSNELPSTIVSPTLTTTYIINAAANNCDAQANIIVIILPGGIPFTESITICENANPLNLSPFVSPSNLSGTWSGAGVSGSTFNPMGLPGTNTLTYAPTSTCYDDGILTVEVTADQPFTLGTDDVCRSSGLFDLTSLEENNGPGGNWSGAGVANNFLNPSTLSGSVTLTFTPTDGCISPRTTVINIQPDPIPNVQTNNIICQGATIDLLDYVTNPQGLALSFYFILPAIPNNELPSSIVTVFNSTTYFVKIIDNNGCEGVAPLNIIALPGGAPQLGTATICQNQTTYNLNQLNDPNVGSGVWSGPGVGSGGILTTTNQVGTITLDFTPSNLCFDAAQTQVIIVVSQTPVLTSDELCSSVSSYDLNTLVDPLFPIGTWSGPGVINNTFIPTGLSGNISLTFASNEFCVNDVTTFINVIPSDVPILESITLCETTSFIDLNTLEDPRFPDGTWSGAGVNGESFETAGLNGTIAVTFTSTEPCILEAIASIQILEQVSPQLQPFSVCANGDPIALNAYLDPRFTSGAWTGSGVANGVFDPDGLAGTVALTFTSDELCTLEAITTATINPLVTVSNLTTVCDLITQTYTVQFNINGGDPNSYTVNNNSSSIGFVSSPIASETNFIFAVTDINQCNVVTIQGTKNCNCITNAGSMNLANSPLKVCSDGIATAIYNNDGSLDDNDKLLFVFHDGSSVALGNVFSISNEPKFVFPTNGVLGQLYYISAVIGDSLSVDSIDFDASCFSVAAGVPVTFYEPAIKLTAANETCIDSCVDILIDASGEGPFRFVILTKIENQIVDTDTIRTNIRQFNKTICPRDFFIDDGTISIEIKDFSDRNCASRQVSPSVDLKINPERKSEFITEICRGEILIINGNTYNENNPKGIETIKSNVSGQCDSIITIDLKYVQPSTFELKRTLCNTEEITVNGSTYNVSNPKGEEILLGQSAFGCDSIVNIDLSFTNELVSQINTTFCPGESIIINGSTYDENRPTGIERISSLDPTKCDSLITINLQYIKNIIALINDTLCQNETKVINGTVYTNLNPKGEEILKGLSAFGCDSIVNIDLSFLPISTSILVDSLCDGEEIVINGTTFNQNRPTGSFMLLSASKNGCDSLINVNLFFYPRSVDTVFFTIKSDSSFIYNGIKFDAINTSALTQSSEPTSEGCLKFSFVRVTIEDAPILVAFQTSRVSCPEKSDGNITIDNISGCSDYTLTFNNTNYTSISTPFKIENLAPGQYNLTLQCTNGNRFESNVIIQPSTSVGFAVSRDFFEVTLGENKDLDINITPLPTTILWEPADFLNCTDCVTPTINNQTQDLRYVVSATDRFGCSYDYPIDVRIRRIVKEIVYPNIFSPNGDGSNDSWGLIQTDSQVIKSLTIYDRWGNKVFNALSSPNEDKFSWDGNINNRPALPGVYVFLAEINEGSSRKFLKGDFTLLR